MIIGIDASALVVKQKTGVEWYVAHLLEELKTLAPEATVFLYGPPGLAHEVKSLPLGWRVVELYWPFKRFWNLIRFSLHLAAHPVDVLWIPSNIVPFGRWQRCITTIHDVGFHEHANLYHSLHRLLQEWGTKRAVRYSSTIIVPSAFTKTELMRLYDCDASRIQVIHHGFAPAQRESPAASPTIQTFVREHDRQFFLIVGRLEEKKNTRRIIDAFTRWRHAQQDSQFQLVFVGPLNTNDRTVAEVIEQQHTGIRIFSWIAPEDLDALYRHARAVIHCALYEGFGLPVIEAMSYGLPVIASDIPPIREIAGAIPLYVRPGHIDELMTAMTQCVNDDFSIKKRSQEGIRHVRQWSWSDSAQATWRVLKAH